MKTYIALFSRNSILPVNKFHFRFTGEKNLYLVIIQRSFVAFIVLLMQYIRQIIKFQYGLVNLSFSNSEHVQMNFS
jgi:uncharacterized membrane protein